MQYHNYNTDISKKTGYPYLTLFHLSPAPFAIFFSLTYKFNLRFFFLFSAVINKKPDIWLFWFQ